MNSKTGRCLVNLSGEGVSPVLAIEPEEASGRFDMGHILAGDVGVREIILRNCSVFPLSFSVERLPPPPDALNWTSENFDNSEVFSLTPSDATIAANETCVVKAFFRPDHERPCPSTVSFRVNVPSQEVEQFIHLEGRCWNRQAYVVPQERADEPKAQDPARLEDAYALPPGNVVAEESQQRQKIVLEFPSDEPEERGKEGAQDRVQVRRL